MHKLKTCLKYLLLSPIIVLFSICQLIFFFMLPLFLIIFIFFIFPKELIENNYDIVSALEDLKETFLEILFIPFSILREDYL